MIAANVTCSTMAMVAAGATLTKVKEGAEFPLCETLNIARQFGTVNEKILIHLICYFTSITSKKHENKGVPLFPSFMADLNKYLFNLCLTEIKRMFICNEKYFQSCILSLLTMFYSLFEDPKVKFENVIKIPVYDNYRMVLVFPSSPFPPPTYTCNLKVSFGRMCLCKDL